MGLGGGCSHCPDQAVRATMAASRTTAVGGSIDLHGADLSVAHFQQAPRETAQEGSVVCHHDDAPF